MCFFYTSVLCRAWVRSKPQVIVTGKATSWLAPEGKQPLTEYLCEMCMCSCKHAYVMEARWDLLPAHKKSRRNALRAHRGTRPLTLRCSLAYFSVALSGYLLSLFHGALGKEGSCEGWANHFYCHKLGKETSIPFLSAQLLPYPFCFPKKSNRDQRGGYDASTWACAEWGVFLKHLFAKKHNSREHWRKDMMGQRAMVWT
eukprot:scaffold1758_cov333-Pavlova_lutheri.AAC.7